MKSVSLFLCSLLLVACAGVGKDDWKGKHRDDLISYYGPPKKETVLPDGGKELVYQELMGRLVCTDTYITDSQGVITDWSSECL